MENQQNNLVAILKQHDEDEEANIPQTRIDKANAAAVKLLLEIKKAKGVQAFVGTLCQILCEVAGRSFGCRLRFRDSSDA